MFAGIPQPESLSWLQYLSGLHAYYSEVLGTYKVFTHGGYIQEGIFFITEFVTSEFRQDTGPPAVQNVIFWKHHFVESYP